jgi:hypothetical protein
MALTRIQPSGLDITLSYKANNFTANYVTFSDGSVQTTAGGGSASGSYANSAFTVANNALSNTRSLITVNGTSQLYVSNTTPSLSNTTGALTVAGGLGVSGNIYSQQIFTNGGTIDGTIIGGTTAAAGTFTTLAAQSANITGGNANLLTYSQLIGGTNWGNTGTATSTQNSAVAPDSTTTASTLTGANGTTYNGNVIREVSITTVSSTTYTFSAYVKAGTATTGALGFRDNSTGSDTTSSFVPTSSWQRVSITGTTGPTTTSINIYFGGTNGTLLVWGAQVNSGSVATIYVATTAAPVTGNPSLSFSGSPYIGLQSDGSLYETSAGTSPIRFYTNNIGQEQARVTHTSSAVNYHNFTGSATTYAPVHSVAGSDSNISLAIQSKGTGAIDLAAGANGVSISNGTSVTALTRTNIGSSYTGFPTITISSPTLNGGVQATANAQLVAAGATVVSGGTSGTYALNDVLTVTTAGGSSPITLTVTGVSAGVITSVSVNSSALTTIPSGTVTVSGGGGLGATFNLLYVLAASFTITAAGSGYVEQPTVTFSGGGGSGAAAYATVGSGTTVRSLGSTMSFYTPQGEQVRITDSSFFTGVAPALSITRDTANRTQLRSGGNLSLYSQTGGAIYFQTNNGSDAVQMVVPHLASAVNYVQVVGAVTTAAPTLSSQGSDLNVAMVLQPKGTGGLDIAAGANGVNISNGTSVTALTLVNGGSGYTTVPTITISAPTTSGGVTATANAALMQINSGTTIASGGTGYVTGDTISIVGGTSTVTATATVTASGGIVSAITLTQVGTYSALPTNPISTANTTGVGTGLTLTGNWTVKTPLGVNTAGSGYVEQPTVTFSTGNAVAFANVGSGTIVKSLGSTMSFSTSSGESLRLGSPSSTANYTNYVTVTGDGAGNTPTIQSTLNLRLSSGGTTSIIFATNYSNQTQFWVNHTASAVNYGQVTGGATGTGPTFSAQGSDTNADLNLAPKNTGKVVVAYNSGQSGLGFANATSIIASYTYYNQGSGSMDTVFA